MGLLHTKTKLNPSRHTGFTLMELVVVMAISSLLMLIAITGQHKLQQRARFDASINKTIQNIAYARNFAMSNVNVQGGGNDATTEAVGVSLEFDNDHHFDNLPLEEMAPTYAQPNADGTPNLTNLLEIPSAGIGSCNASEHPDDPDECWEQFMPIPDDLSVSSSSVPGAVVAILFFINTGQGLKVCHDISPLQVTALSACATPTNVPFDFILTDPEGLSATIRVDPVSGLAKRLN